jgi:hypothetical protein
MLNEVKHLLFALGHSLVQEKAKSDSRRGIYPEHGRRTPQNDRKPAIA